MLAIADLGNEPIARRRDLTAVTDEEYASIGTQAIVPRVRSRRLRDH